MGSGRIKLSPRRPSVAAAAAVAVLLAGVAVAMSGPEPTRTGRAAVPPTLLDVSALRARPTTGPAWAALQDVADGDLGDPDLADQDNLHAGRTFAAAVVHARTGQPAYREKVVTELQELVAAPLDGARVLSVARQLAGYVLAADLVGYRDATFVAFVWELRTRELGHHDRWTSVTQTSADTSSNWGAWALASRLAVSLYVRDEGDVTQASRVFRGFLGDRSAHSGFRPTADFDPSWACGGAEDWVPVNPAGCGPRDGALVEDISRSDGAFPAVDDVGRTYSWEALGGATLSATLLARAGFPDVWEWSDRALLRAARFLQRAGGYPPRYSTNQYVPWVLNRAYGVDLGPVRPAGLGRQYGFTDWLP